VITVLTEMRELQRVLDTSWTRQSQPQASNDATTRPPQQAPYASLAIVQELEASGNKLPNALAGRQQELNASRTRELELVASRAQLSEASPDLAVGAARIAGAAATTARPDGGDPARRRWND
jgi:hypothetical protein